MKKKGLLCFFLIFLFMASLSFTSCKDCGGILTARESSNLPPHQTYEKVFPYAFQTEYTQAEHIERITAITEENLGDLQERGIIENVWVEILYAFYDENPRYFLVELTFSEEFQYTYKNKIETSRFQHLIGYIKDDKYYCADGWTGPNGGDFHKGPSAYTYYGYKGAKKYFGDGVCGVACRDGILEIYNGACEPIVEMQEKYRGGVDTRLIAEESYEDLMKNRSKPIFYKQLYKYTLLNFY